MKLILFAVLTALLLTLAAGYVLLPVLRRMKAGQTISSSVTAVHSGKQGTLTMGGIFFLGAGLVTSLVFSLVKSCEGHLILYCAGATIAFALIGFGDDYLKIVLRRNEGLTQKQKLLPQVLFAVIFAFIAYANPHIGSAVCIPFTDSTLDLGIFYIPFTAFVIVAVDNSVNLLDGLDGLCAGSSMIEMAMFGCIALALGEKFRNVALFAFVMSACLVGFHRFNAHPARVFMGDIGSLGLGGALAALSIVTNSMLILPVALITAVVCAVSDIAQVVYMRRHRGRKLLRMSPLHHHFELAGIPEETIVTAYNIVTFACCVLALIAMLP